jgi:hypothetical protein
MFKASMGCLSQDFPKMVTTSVRASINAWMLGSFWGMNPGSGGASKGSNLCMRKGNGFDLLEKLEILLDFSQE